MKLTSDRIPPWKLLLPSIDFTLSNLSKQTTSPLVYQKQFLYMREFYPDHLFLCTDSSSCSDAVACGFYCIRATKSFRLHSKCSIFIAEMYAIFEALKYIESATLRRVVIYSDSLSSLQAVSRPSSDYLTLSVQSLLSPRRGGLVHVLTGGCREGSQVFLSPFFHLLASHFMSCTFFSLLFLPHWPSLYAERPPMCLPCMATRVGGNVCPGS